MMSIGDLSSISDTYDRPTWEGDEVEVVAPQIYGRTQEINVLLRTFQRVLETSSRAATVIIHGESGVGEVRCDVSAWTVIQPLICVMHSYIYSPL